MYSESDYLLLSGLQHLCFCPRQCALIHIEQLWSENYLTASGRLQHEKVHSGLGESRKIIRIERDLKVSSSLLGISGKTDAVEFFADGRIIPVEYKHGEPKDDSSDEWTWVSTDKPHMLELEDGEYSLCETIAPSGYEPKTECIDFSVEEGKVNAVKMENSPVHIPNTGATINRMIILFGFGLVIAGL